MARAVLDGRAFGAFLHLYLPSVGLHVQARPFAASSARSHPTHLCPPTTHTHTADAHANPGAPPPHHPQTKSLEAGDANMICGIISSQWLMKLFVNVIPDDATLAIWDLIVATRSRHPLFCASLALLEPHAEQICSAPELGTCVQIMQARAGSRREPKQTSSSCRRSAAWHRHDSTSDTRPANEPRCFQPQEIPNELKSPEAVSAFASRLQAWSAKVDAEHLRLILGRELGENGPQPGLEKAPDLVPLTDQAEVLAGCVAGLLAGELRDIAAGNAEDPVATVESIQGDMQNIHALGGDNDGNEAAILSDDEARARGRAAPSQSLRASASLHAPSCLLLP